MFKNGEFSLLLNANLLEEKYGSCKETAKQNRTSQPCLHSL